MKEPIFTGKTFFTIRKKIIELEVRELKDWELKVKREMEELFLNQLLCL